MNDSIPWASNKAALGRPSERRLRILSSLAVGFLLAAPLASAQSVGLADVLAANASCANVEEARVSLETTLGSASPDTPQDTIVAALRVIAGRDDLCAEVREAARTFAEQAAEPPPARPADMSSTSSSIVAATLAEAERRAANLTFDVTPPPRFMTRERNSRP